MVNKTGSIQVNKNIRWGIIGCGNVSHRFMQGLRALTGTHLVAAWSRNPASVQAFVELYGGSRCNTMEELLASDIDAVYIATLPDSHVAYSMAALKAGKHVLCEKPAAINLVQLDQVLRLAIQKKLLFMEGMKPPFFPLYQQLKVHLQTDPIGQIGFVRAGSSVTNLPADHPSLNNALAGGSIMGIGIYEAFLGVDWLGEATQVQAMGKLGDTGVDVFSIFQTEHEKGYGQFYTGFELHGKGDALICGSLGNITIHKNWWNPTLATIDYLDGRRITLDVPFTSGGFNYEIAHFCELISNNFKESPLVSHQLSRQMIAMLDKVRAIIGLRFEDEAANPEV